MAPTVTADDESRARVASSPSRGSRPRCTESPLSAENRLTADQLAALGVGDHVTIESGQDFRAPRCTAGTVTRVTEGEIVVRCAGRAGGVYIERYSRRDGPRIGRGNRAELVNTDPAEAVDDEQRRAVRRIDAAYRAWARARHDVGLLRELDAAATDQLQGGLPPVDRE